MVKILEQVVQGSGGCPISGGVYGQAGWGFEQAGQVEGIPAQDREGGTTSRASRSPSSTNHSMRILNLDFSDSNKHNASVLLWKYFFILRGNLLCLSQLLVVH